ncbi:unnamed protein product [Thlaspi arvense]|uniref:Splicing factor Cactin n=1 Tax=Thlaspi arvense TaxID=13288 RepID=A0AAU9S9W1_THLAR|nr:unnamed protein product [Thlaspi arvense]
MVSHGRHKRQRDESESGSEEETKEYLLAQKAQRKALSTSKKLKRQQPDLAERFVWWKKIEKDVHHGASLDQFSVKAEKRRHKEKMAELAKLTKRKEDGAAERARREEDMSLLARERARAEFQDWEKKEQEFCLGQSKARSKIRLRQGRAKPIDVLYKHLDDDDGSESDVELSEPPYMVFKGLTVKDLEELRGDIKMYLDSDRATSTRVKYWEALAVVCDGELTKARKRDALELLAQEKGLQAVVEADVRELLDGKTHEELVQMQIGIKSRLRSELAEFAEFWVAVLKILDICKAKACLKEIHAEKLRRHLHSLEENAEEEFAFSQEEADDVAAISFSPELIHGDDDLEEEVDPREDEKLLETKRMVVLERRKKQPNVEDSLEVKAMKAMGAMEEGDAVFGSNAEVDLDTKWHDKYRPRKPKYFNRVHTSYEWNKYNQTHYDHDSPPPKVVQGYKFNIFYPDLLDKAKAPTCSIEKDGTSAETCIIRFQAGPPYEDIAFRIVNKEWERSRKKGFKHTFDGGILNLYFRFKRHRYRR